MGKKIYAALAACCLAAVLIGCGASNTKAQESSSAPETLQVVYQNDGYCTHYILRDNETGYEYIVAVKSQSYGVGIAITPRLGISGKGSNNEK